MNEQIRKKNENSIIEKGNTLAKRNAYIDYNLIWLQCTVATPISISQNRYTDIDR